MRSILGRVLGLFLPPSDRGHVLAEMEELYTLKIERVGRRAADAWFRRHTLGFMAHLAFSRKGDRRSSGRRRERNVPVRGGRRFETLSNLTRELRLTSRTLLRARAFVILSSLSLALGLGAATTIFSIANAVLFRPAPFQDPDRLVGIPQGDFGTHTYPNFLALRDECSSFLELAAYDETGFGERASDPVFLMEGSDAVPVNLALVSGEYFSVLGVAPTLGRPLLPHDNDVAGGNPVAVLSWAFLQRRFGGDAEVVGREINLSGTTYTVVGVAPPGFSGTTHQSSPDLWIPSVMRGALQPPEDDFDIVTHPEWYWTDILGRLKPGVSEEVARARLNAVVASSQSVSPSLKEDSISVRPIKEAAISLLLRERNVEYLSMLLMAVGLVVLVVFVNVTNLFMGRMDEREAEVAIRRALGAGRGALARQFLLEAGVVAGLGGVGALLLSVWLSDLLFGMMARGMRLSTSATDLSPDIRVLGFTFALVAACSLVIGGVSAFRHRSGRISALLSPGSRVVESSTRLFSLQNVLVTAQLTLSIVLLVGAGLMVRSFLGLQNQDFGLETENTLVLTIDNERIPMEPEDGTALYARIIERIRAIPDLEAAAMAKVAPLSGITWGGIFEFEGFEVGEEDRRMTDENYVDPGFFSMLGVEIVQGRGFTASDVQGAERVVIVNEALVKKYWPDASPLGKTIRWQDNRSFRVVGVVRDHFYSHLRRGAVPLTYYPLAQHFLKNPVILARGRSAALSLAPMIREVVREIHPELVLFKETTLESQIVNSASRERVTAFLLVAYAGLALLLAVIGTYGVASRMVVRRWKEIGIRTALGAQKGELLSLVFTSGMRVVVLGLLMGLLFAFVAGSALKRLIFGVAPMDPLTLLLVAVTLLATGAAACLIPARKALGADPAEVLRDE